MSYPINYPTPQNANVQIFGGAGNNAGSELTQFSWVKPQGASFVWFTLIGAGGGGDTATGGGGSGAVTNFMCPAFLIPDELIINVGQGGVNNGDGANTVVLWKSKGEYTLLTANGGKRGTSGTAGAATAANYFTAMGFYQSIAGQAGSGVGVSASSTTFLSGGGWGTNQVVGNYGYQTRSTGGSGFFQFQPIIVGVGGSDAGGRGGIGCGGAGDTSAAGHGGNGLAVIITW